MNYGENSKMDLNTLKILIVDDDPGVRDSYRQILSPSPALDFIEKGAQLFDGKDRKTRATSDPLYDITLTDRGEAGVAAVGHAASTRTPFAVAFVDMMMPGIDGAETAKRIWQIDPAIKIVIVTAYSDHTPDDIVGLVGREDLFYLRKPFNPAEIRQFAKALTNQWRLERERELLSAKLERARKQEIDTAARIQQSLLFGDPPQDMQHFDVYLKTIPSQKVDGDFFDFLPMRPSLLDVVVGDVMGKGISAALVAAGLKNRLMRSIGEFIVSKDRVEIPSLEEILTSLHHHMISALERHETFATLVYARFDFSAQALRYIDCGHTRTIHYQQSERACRLLEGVNMPIGFPEKEAFSGRSVHFASGDIFVFYSDGLTEARNPSGEMYGEERLVDFIRQHADLGVMDLLERLFQEVVGFKQSELFNDDYTCIGIQIKPAKRLSLANSSQRRLEMTSNLNELRRARAFVRSFFSEAVPGSIGRSRVDLFELAVNEAVVNIIEHAYENAPGRPILIEAEASVTTIVFRLYDWGLSFDPTVVPAPAFDGTRDHGFGVYIISNAVDEVDYSRDDTGRNCTTLSIRLTGGN